jgi:hypothetical protein
VRRAAQAFYREHANVVRQLPGCESCRDVCHYGPAAKRVADQREVRTALWAYAISCARHAGSAAKGWPLLVDRLAAPAVAGPLRPAEKEDFAWCVGQLAAERAFLELCRRGTSLNDLASLLVSFAQMCAALRGQSQDTAQRVSQFRVKAGRILQKEHGPWEGCAACTARCVFEPLGAVLASRMDLRDGLAKAFKEKDPDGAVRKFCERAAATTLFTSDADTIRRLALCFYAHVAARVNVRDAAEMIQRLFPVP